MGEGWRDKNAEYTRMLRQRRSTRSLPLSLARALLLSRFSVSGELKGIGCSYSASMAAFRV